MSDITLRCAAAVLSYAIVFSPLASASDHADPIDPFYLQRQEGAITDLFVFPVRKLDAAKPLDDYRQIVANAFERLDQLPLHDPLSDIVRTELTAAQQADIQSIVFLLCVRRQLSDANTLKLEPYEFRIHIDVNSVINFPTPADLTTEDAMSAEHSPVDGPPAHEHRGVSLVESYARYGGQIPNPQEISEEITISIRLTNQAEFAGAGPRYSGSAASNWSNDRIRSASGIFDDPFILPAFFGTNVVGIAIEVPIDLLPADRTDFLIWATSHKGSKQIDHVGRSLRTQNPRFELLNTLHPNAHVQAIRDEHTNPSLKRDLLLRANLASYFAFRRWDFVPDVMCFSTRYPAGFPNGRLLTDDVAAILAQHGDTLLYELSYQDNGASWPRQNVNDTAGGRFAAKFPFLNPPHQNVSPAVKPRLSWNSILKLAAIAILLLGLFVLENWIVARIYCHSKSRRRAL